MKHFGERLFFIEDFQFFIRILEDLTKERANSTEVIINLKFIPFAIIQLTFQQKYHDFIEMATEAIGEFSKDVNGEAKPMWEKDEVNEIVIAQVIQLFNLK